VDLSVIGFVSLIHLFEVLNLTVISAHVFAGYV